jgi:hypothetical protein
LEGPSNGWQEGPGLVESIRRYWWLVAIVALVGASAAFAWSSRQPVLYEGVVRVFPDTGGEETTDADRIVQSQAELLTSPVVLDRTVALIDGRLTRQELQKRLTVEPVRDADVITIRVLDATPELSATLADKVVQAYRDVVARQAADAAAREAAAVVRRQHQLEDEIAALEAQLVAEPSNRRLQADRDAKVRQLNQLADRRESARPDGPRVAERFREKAAIPDERVQPKPLRTAAMGALLAAVAAAVLAWWLHGRQWSSSRRMPRGNGGADRAGLDVSPALRLPGRLRSDQMASSNGAPIGNGSASGIVDFDQIATSVQELFRFLDGPSQRLYEENLPQLAADEIAQRFRLDLVAILLDNAGEVQTMGSVGLRASRTGTLDHGVRHLIEVAARNGPRLVDHDELVRLASTGLGADQADSLALVPLIRDHVGFGVLVAGRRQTDDMIVMPISDREVEDIGDSTRDMVPYLWAWLLLRNLKLRLRTLQ